MAPGESEHLDFIDKKLSYEDQLHVASKAYLDWYMLSQVSTADETTAPEQHRSS